MKVELDLSSAQLEQLDNDLVKLMENLTEGQKIEIVKGYINFQFDKMETTYHDDYWNRDKTVVSKFGENLVAGLQEQIKNSITDKIMEDENLQSIIKETVDNIVNNLSSIIEKALSTYITENLFLSQSKIQEQIHQTIWQMNQGR